MTRLGDLIKPAKVIRCGTNQYPVLSMTMHDGIMLQSDRFKKSLASVNQSDYKVVNYGQLAVGFPIDEGVLYIQRVVPSGIMSPAYSVWDVNYDIVDPLYLELSLHSPQAMQYYKENLRGTTARRRSIPTDTLLALPLRLPSLEEQRIIAAVLDKVSGLIAKRRQQLDKLDEIVKAKFVEMFGDPVGNPMGWEKIALGKRCDIVTGNTPSRADPENYGNFIEWIKSDNINTPAVLLTEAQEYLSETGFHKCRFVEAGSLLMTCIAGSINCIGNVAVADRRVAFNQQINAIVPKQDDVLYLYWLMLLSKPAIHSTINMSLKGILSKGQLSEMTFPFPPLELQNQFAVFVKKTEKTKANISCSLEKLETLKKALMQEYLVR